MTNLIEEDEISDEKEYDQWVFIEDIVTTRVGPMLVASKRINTSRAIFTFPDLAMSSTSNYGSFFNYSDMLDLQGIFSVYHINAPGLEACAPDLPDAYIYPTMDELAEAIEDIRVHYRVERFIAFGMGVGANILARYTLRYPNIVDGLCVINCNSSTASWSEYLFLKFNRFLLKTKKMNITTLEYFMWYYFGYNYSYYNCDLAHMYNYYFNHTLNPTNFALFLQSYIQRTDLGLFREVDPSKRLEGRNFICPTLVISGSLSPHLDSTVDTVKKINPDVGSWIKLYDCALPLEEFPGKVIKAFKFFLQGAGHALALQPKISNLSLLTKRLSSREMKLAPILDLESKIASISDLKMVDSREMESGPLNLPEDNEIRKNIMHEMVFG